MGEIKKNIYIIGSPDLDILLGNSLPLLENVKQRYGIKFQNYAIFIFHPVTTELDSIKKQIDKLIETLVKSQFNYIILLPNNDLGGNIIYEQILKLKEKN